MRQGSDYGCSKVFSEAGHDMSDMSDMNSILEPGMLVRHPQQPDWGTGQVQSNIAGRITVNFREVGKVVIDGARVELVPVFDP